jgi:predicted component of type VI protein secretion system
MARSPMLFVPPQPPRMLPQEGSLVIGRSRGVDLCLADPDTSRRHAEIVCSQGSFSVRDLGSTNGTWVNGARVEACALKPGDRIQIGSQEIAFCEVEGSPSLIDHGDEAQTQLFERSVAPESFRGDLAEIPTFAVLQILEMGRKTGILTIDSGAAQGRLWLRGGDPVHAQVKGQIGFDAAVALVNADHGRFGFEPSAEVPERTIEASVTELLLEASRLLDEGLVG